MVRLAFAVLLLIQSPLMAQQTSETFFASVTIRPSSPTEPVSVVPYPGGKVVARGVTAGLLIQFAFRTTNIDFSRCEPWVTRAAFDVTAIPEFAISRESSFAAMKAFLEKRFGLVAHLASRENLLFSIMNSNDHPLLETAAPRREGERGGVSQVGNSLTGRDISVTDLAEALTALLGYRVIDRTDLPDRYDLSLELPPRVGPGSLYSAEALSAELSLRYGLRLNRSVDNQQFLVVDSITRPHTD